MAEDRAASCFLGALAFTDQVNTMTMKTLPTSQLLQWLNSAHGPSLVEAGREHDQRSALALVLTLECLYDPNSSRVGLTLVYKPIYVKTVSFGEAYFHLRMAVEAASGKIIDPLIMFVLLSGSSEVIPRMNDHPLFLDVSSPSYIEETGPPQRVQCFRGFKLHRAICLYAGESISHVAYPRLEGGRESYYMLPQRQKITPEILESLRLTVSLAPVDKGHWNIVNDPLYPACLDQFRERHEAASKNPTSQQFQVPDVSQMFGPMAMPSDSTVPTPTLLSTLPLGSEDVNRIVQETLDTFHDLRIEAIQGMGAIREIDRSLSKGIMSEFLRLQLIMCNDLSKSLTSLRSEVRTLTQSLLRDLRKFPSRRPGRMSQDLKTLNDVWWGLYRKDFKSVDEVRARILKLDEGEEPTRKQIETSPIFKLRKASSSSDESKSFLASIGKHWIPYFEKKSLLANCKPRD